MTEQGMSDLIYTIIPIALTIVLYWLIKKRAAQSAESDFRRISSGETYEFFNKPSISLVLRGGELMWDEYCRCMEVVLKHCEKPLSVGVENFRDITIISSPNLSTKKELYDKYKAGAIEWWELHPVFEMLKKYPNRIKLYIDYAKGDENNESDEKYGHYAYILPSASILIELQDKQANFVSGEFELWESNWKKCKAYVDRTNATIQKLTAVGQKWDSSKSVEGNSHLDITMLDYTKVRDGRKKQIYDKKLVEYSQLGKLTIAHTAHQTAQ